MFPLERGDICVVPIYDLVHDVVDSVAAKGLAFRLLLVVLVEQRVVAVFLVHRLEERFAIELLVALYEQLDLVLYFYHFLLR